MAIAFKQNPDGSWASYRLRKKTAGSETEALPAPAPRKAPGRPKKAGDDNVPKFNDAFGDEGNP